MILACLNTHLLASGEVVPAAVHVHLILGLRLLLAFILRRFLVLLSCSRVLIRGDGSNSFYPSLVELLSVCIRFHLVPRHLILLLPMSPTGLRGRLLRLQIAVLGTTATVGP